MLPTMPPMLLLKHAVIPPLVAAVGVPFAPEELPPNDPGGFELAFGELEGAVPPLPLPLPLPTGGTYRGCPHGPHVE